MLQTDRGKSSKKDLATSGHIECGSKRHKVIVQIEEILSEFDDVFFQEGQKMRFCNIEKCKIITKKGEKAVKKRVIVPQTLRKVLENTLKTSKIEV